MHLRDIERFLAGHHLTVNVRTEDEIDMESILKKVSEITGSSYNFKEKPQGMEHSPEPVGTAHRKINPLQELPKMSEREQFWSRDQEEEKKRIVEERQKRTIESVKAEEERKKREELENKARDTQINEREKKISQIRESEKSGESLSNSDTDRWKQQQVTVSWVFSKEPVRIVYLCIFYANLEKYCTSHLKGKEKKNFW